MGMTLAYLKEEINVSVEIDKLKMLVKITITIIGNNFNKKAGIPSVPTLNLV